MAETTMVSERDAVRRERAAAVRAWQTIAAELRAHGDNHSAELVSSRFARLADELYPMPKVKRIRVEKDPHDVLVQWSARDDLGRMRMMGRVSSDVWGYYPRDREGMLVTPERVAVWSDLFANPTELVDVEDDGSAAASPEGR